jgi:transposase
MGLIRNDGMTTTLGELPPDLETCHQLIRELLESLAEQTHLNEKLQHQLEQLLRQRYGRKTEKLDPAQLLLFAREILAAGETTTPESPPPPDTPPTPAPSNPRKKKGHGRKPLPASLPRKQKSTTSPPRNFPVPTAAPCGLESARRSASNSSTSRPA